MQQLVIEYVFEGYRRGYDFTSPTRGYNDETLKLIWRMAMPRGQGWGADMYLGAISLKCFPVDERRVAVSTVTVTDQTDEGGRRGIRRAVIDVLTNADYIAYLETRFNAYPASILAQIENKPSFWQRRKILDKARSDKKNTQAILTRDYVDSTDWQVIDAVMLKLITSNQRRNEIISFTTLALDYRDETSLVALPAQQTAQMPDVNPIKLK